MANLSKTYNLFGFTSPRTLEKVLPEIALLTELFTGQIWNGKTQRDFFDALSQSEFYEGKTKVKNPDMAARDRITRAPKSLGLVRLKPTIGLTPAGQELLATNRPYDLLTRQLMKFQLPSFYHKIAPERGFKVRPYLELLRLVRDAGSLSKTEIALFFLPLVSYEQYDEALSDLRAYRKEKAALKEGRKRFTQAKMEEVLMREYDAEITKKNFKTRESNTNTLSAFLKKKQRNANDYADAFMRYLRATQLVTLDRQSFRLTLSSTRREEAEFLLNTVPREPEVFASLANFENYLFEPSNLTLLSDDENRLKAKLAGLQVQAPKKATVGELNDILEQAENKHLVNQTEQALQALKHFQQYEDVDGLFTRIIKKGEISDAPLWLEWNVWRALAMMNYFHDLKGNFKTDLDGIPLSTAPGSTPDLQADYGDFKLIIEVTMSSGNKQYEMEGEPVARHYGKAKEAHPNQPVYCLFVAPNLSAGAVAHFFNLNRFKTKLYGGQTNILPLSLVQFRQVVAHARARKFSKPAQLEQLFKGLIEYGRECDDESVWQQAVQLGVNNWLQA